MNTEEKKWRKYFVIVDNLQAKHFLRFSCSVLFHHYSFLFSPSTNNEQSNTEVIPPTENPSKTKKRKTKHLSNEQQLLTDMSDERLQVYGLNPKRFRNFVRFNKEKKD